MKRASLPLALLIAAAPLVAPAAETVTLVADVWCPYNCKPGSEMLGIGVDLAKRVFEPRGIKVEYGTMDWDRAVKETRAGQHAAIVGAYRTDLPDFTYPGEPIGQSHMGVFVRKGDGWKYAGIGSLAGRRLGVVEGYTYGEPFDGFIRSGSGVVKTPGDDALAVNVKKLLEGGIDTILEDRYVFQLRSRSMYVTDRLAEAGSAARSIEVFIAFSPRRPESARLARIFTEGVGELRKSGELQVILRRYGMKDWK